MVLDELTDGASRHLSAFNPFTDPASRKLLFILCLPFLDGVFATLLVTGAVETFSQILNVAFTIFSGAGALAVLYSQSENRKDAQRMVVSVTPALLLGAAGVAVIAPVFEQLFDPQSLKLAAGLAVLVISGQLGGVRHADKLSVPAIMITGFVLSLRQPESLYLSFRYMVPAVQTALTSALVLYIATFLDSARLDLNYVRKGGAAVLLVISASLMGLNVPSELGLMVFALSIAAGAHNR